MEDNGSTLELSKYCRVNKSDMASEWPILVRFADLSTGYGVQYLCVDYSRSGVAGLGS